MNRILGFDLGSKTLGISISDPLGMIARALTTVRFQSDDYDDAFQQAMAVIKEEKADTIVLGLPKHMIGDVGERGEISIAFSKRFEDVGIKVVLWDERLTTVAAIAFCLKEMFPAKKEKKSLIKWQQFRYFKVIWIIQIGADIAPFYELGGYICWIQTVCML